MDALIIQRGGLEDVECAIRLGWNSVTVRHADSRAETWRRIRDGVPDVIVIDAASSDGCPLALARELRDTVDSIIVIATSAYDEYELVTAVDAGADDYVSIPINPALFVPRVRAALRRKSVAGRAREVPIQCGGLDIDPAKHDVEIAGQCVPLPDSEFRVLLELMKSAGFVVSKDALSNVVWGDEQDIYAPWLRKYIQSLRRKICDQPGSDVQIVTIPKVGYKLVASNGI